MAKYIFVTGGVISSLGKGITAAAIGRLLKSRGLKVTMQKFDPYINVDPGMMSPYEHGEVFVTHDGGETDLDLGHYERFVDVSLGKASSVTAGKIYLSLINKERKGEYGGSTVQVIPHITNEIKKCVYRVGKEDNADVVITEIGGTVGDIEGLPFLEAIRQVRKEVGRNDILYIHVTLVPYISAASELKTKPTQHSVKELRSIGISPDIIVCRTEQEISSDLRDKLALFCDINPEDVITNRTVESIYQVPLLLEEQGMDDIIMKKLCLPERTKDLSQWREMVSKILGKHEKNMTIAIVGKYVELPDAYLSVSEAIRHAGIVNDVGIKIKWISTEQLQLGKISLVEAFGDVDGILAQGGFDEPAVEGNVMAIEYARVNQIPFFGIGAGMQGAVIEYARNVCGLKGASTTEFNEGLEYPVIDVLSEQAGLENSTNKVRLGAYPCKLKEGSLIRQSYNEEIVYERHRNKYEFNNSFRDILADKGLVISGVSPNDRVIEAIELSKSEHPWFVGVQFHPELKSRPTNPHPLFIDFIAATIAACE